MKIKLGEIEKIIEGLNGTGNKRLPVKLLFAITKNKKALMPECTNFLEQREKLYQRDCIKNEDGTPALTKDKSYQFKTEEIKSRILAERNILADTEIEVNIMKVEFSLIEQCEREEFDSITGADMDALDFMIEE